MNNHLWSPQGIVDVCDGCLCLRTELGLFGKDVESLTQLDVEPPCGVGAGRQRAGRVARIAYGLWSSLTAQVSGVVFKCWALLSNELRYRMQQAAWQADHEVKDEVVCAAQGVDTAFVALCRVVAKEVR